MSSELCLLLDSQDEDDNYKRGAEAESELDRTERGEWSAHNRTCSRLIIFGDAPACAAWAKAMPFAVSAAESTLRGAGQVVFANNPFSGMIIYVALAYADPTVAGFALLATFTATLFGFWVLEEEPHDQSRKGLFGYSALLVGAAISTFSAANTPSQWLILPVMLVAILSAMLFTSISRLLAPVKVPAMTLPFNVACLIWFSMALNSTIFDSTISVALTTPAVKHPQPLVGTLLLIKAAFRGIAQVFLCGQWESGVLIFLAVGLASPRLGELSLRVFPVRLLLQATNATTMCYQGTMHSHKVHIASHPEFCHFCLLPLLSCHFLHLALGSLDRIYPPLYHILFAKSTALMGLYGSAVGMFAALAVGIDHQLVYEGLYGYNASLSAQAVGGVMYALNAKGFGFATLAAVISALSTPLFAASLSIVGTSPQTFPFCFGTAMVVLLGDEVKGLNRK
jgi:urea transporter